MKNTLFNKLCYAMLDKETDNVDTDKRRNGKNALFALLLWGVSILVGSGIGHLLYLILG